jgi:hypothetical protein
MKAPFYFKYVPLINYEDIIAELKPYILKYIEGFRFGFHLIEPKLVLDNCLIFSEWIRSSNLQIESIGIIIVAPNTNNIIHIDYTSKPVSSLALNMEIQNCRIPKTKLYLTESTPVITYTLSNTEYCKYNDDAVFTQVGEFDLYQPVLFETQIPHQVCNQTNKRRVSISFRFSKDPEFSIGLPPTPTSL